MVILIIAAQWVSLLAPLDRFLSDARFHFANHENSGQLALVAIDKASLDSVGVWPWPRSVHAQVIDRLRELQAQDIVLDIDFSTPSDLENDAALAAAIDRADGTVTLPVFLQHGDGSKTDTAILTEPIAILAEKAWLAAVNVFPDQDGKVRRFPSGLHQGEAVLPSVPAAIAGAPADGDTIDIDFGIDASGFRTISAGSLLDGSYRGDDLSGMTVIVGAFATELRDFYTVPRHGVVPGTVLQAMAAETLVIGRDLKQVSPLTMIIPALAMMMGLIAAHRRGSSVTSIALLGGAGLVAEACAIALYVGPGIMIPTAIVHVVALAAMAVRLVTASEFFRRLSREAATDARNVRQVLQQVVHDNFDAIIVVDEDGRVLKTSQAVAGVFGLDDPIQADGLHMSELLPQALSQRVEAAIRGAKVGQTQQTTSDTLVLDRPNAAPRTIEYSVGVSRMHGKPTSGDTRRRLRHSRFVVCVTARDITERVAYQERLRWLSDRDQLTGAWRRHAFAERIAEAVKHEPSDDVAVVVINLHRFKTVNVALGRDTGNAVLKSAVERLIKVGGDDVETARLGGDTFAVLLRGVTGAEHANALAMQIVESVGAPYAVDRGEAKVGVHAGIAMGASAKAGTTLGETLIEHAEMALDEARTASGSEIALYDQQMADLRTRSRIIERDLWHALDRNELHLAYQVQVTLADRAPCGAEALLRWTHPQLGNVPPDEFIGIAEANGFIVPLGRWVLFAACREAAGWSVPIPVSVNVAAQQLQSDGFVDEVKEALAKSGLPPERLTIELVETEQLETDEAVLARMRELRTLGVTIALDDFGTGYSGVGYISRLRFDKIKLDRQFTRDIATSIEVQGIVRSVVVLCDAFNMSLVCEGIETRQQESFLRLIGCQEGQGYHYSKPVNSVAFRQMLGESSTVATSQESAAAHGASDLDRKSA